MEFPLVVQLEQTTSTRLKNVLEALSDMFSVANLDFADTGCEIKAMDTSGVALVAFLRADAFGHYRCYDDISMGLSLADMAAVFGCANNGDEITIKAEVGYSDPLCFRFKSPENGEISLFYFDAMHIEGAPLQEPSESEYQTIVRLPSALFMLICEKLSCFGDREDTVVIISADKEGEGVSFFAREEKRTSQIVCRPKEPTQIEMKEKVSLMFALRYIKSFSKVSTLSDQVTIGLSFKKPAVFKCEIIGMGNVRYYISPVDEMQNEGDEAQRITRYYMSAVPVDEDEIQNE